MLDGNKRPDRWQTSVLVPIFKRKVDVRNCNVDRGVKLLERTMKIVERMLERRFQKLVNIDGMQFDFMPGRGTTDALSILRRMREE